MGMVDLGQAHSLLIESFCVMVIGGMGSFAGTAISAAICGLTYSFASIVRAKDRHLTHIRFGRNHSECAAVGSHGASGQATLGDKRSTYSMKTNWLIPSLGAAVFVVLGLVVGNSG